MFKNNKEERLWINKNRKNYYYVSKLRKKYKYFNLFSLCIFMIFISSYVMHITNLKWVTLLLEIQTNKTNV